jgi:hypothetical protein
MRRGPASIVVVLASFCALACLSSIGCSDGRPTLVPVSGQVLIDGKPLTEGSIMFVPANGRPSGGTIDSNGHFVLSCYAPGDGAIVGKHQVKVTAVESIDDRTSRWLAPKKYAKVPDSGIEVTIPNEPVTDLKIELTWDGGKPFIERR